MTEVHVVRHDELTARVAAVLAGRGVPAGGAATVAALMVDADLCGRPSHGVARLPAYLAKLDGGGIDPRAVPTEVHAYGAAFTLDGGNGFGQLALSAAVDAAIRRAREHGVAWGTVRDTNNPGMLLSYGRMAAEAGQLAIIGCNAAPTMAPAGASTPFLGTNPLCVAVPGPDGPYPILDMATTATSKGTIRAAVRAGTAIPPDWAVDADGNPTTDPVAALRGMLRPAGGAKGAGLALMIDILAGLLGGGAAGPAVRGLNTPDASRVGAFVVTVLPEAFADPTTFRDGLQRYVAALRSVPPTAPGGAVLLPGERAWRARQRHLVEGVPVPEKVMREL